MISYIGGKYRIGKWIGEHLPENMKIYGEAFGGAFWVYLRNNIKANEVYYNDFNKFMVNLFASSKKYNQLANYIIGNGKISEPNTWKIAPQNKYLFNKFLKDIFKEEKNGMKFEIPNLKYATEYAYLLTQVFSGTGLKENSKMIDLKGKYKSKFESFVKRLLNPEFQKKLDNITNTLNLDFEDFVKTIDSKDTFIYFDPPYYKTENYYSFHNFGREQHLRLAKTLKNMKGKFALSYYEFPELSEWFPKNKFRWVEKEFAKAASAKKGKKQNKGKEVLIMNY
jgi:DNA adenine methylase